MLTARAEHRLRLRADNADLRLTEQGVAWGVVGAERAARHRALMAALVEARALAGAEGGSPAELARRGILVNPDGRRRSVLELLALPEVPEAALSAAFPWLQGLPARVLGLLRAEALYAPYLARHETERRALEREERLAIPAGIDFSAIAGLSNEMRQRLSAARPASLGAAGRVPGVTPAAIAALAVHLRRGGCST